VTLAEHGKTRRVPALEGILHRALDDGLRGDKGAMKLVLALAERYGESSEKTLNLDEMQAEDRAILARYAIPNASPSDLEANASPGQALDEEGGDDADPRLTVASCRRSCAATSAPSSTRSSRRSRRASRSSTIGTLKRSPISSSGFGAGRSGGSSSTCRRGL
jgi:hypothetical protein